MKKLLLLEFSSYDDERYGNQYVNLIEEQIRKAVGDYDIVKFEFGFPTIVENGNGERFRFFLILKIFKK